MNIISRTITGIIAVVLGIVLIIIAVPGELWLLLYGISIIVIGLFIFFNKKEDDIEQIKKK